MRKHSTGICYACTRDAYSNPRRIYFTDGSQTRYTYSATGEKLLVEHYVAAPNVTVPFGAEPDALTQGQVIYAGSTQYLLGGSLVMKDGLIDRYLFDGGYAKATFVNPTTYTFEFYYYNRDHLGNNREVVDSAGTVMQITHYYPFGTPYADPSTILNASLQPYKYNGKELDRMHGLDTYDYGARQYDPVLGRWDRMDPLCEKYYSISPYVYCANNPVINIDSDGRDYSVYVDNDYGTILISAFFFCTARDYERCSNDCNYWNQQSGLFSAGNYMINFMFTPIVVDNTLESYSIDNNMITYNISNLSDSQSLYNSLNSCGLVDTNTYQTVDKLDNDDFGNAKNGETRSGRIIRICSSNPLTGKHEMGHTAGLGHHPAGLMTSSSSDENRNDQIYETYIKEILKGSLPNRNGVPDAGKGHLIVNGENFDSHVFNRIRKNK